MAGSMRVLLLLGVFAAAPVAWGDDYMPRYYYPWSCGPWQMSPSPLAVPRPAAASAAPAQAPPSTRPAPNFENVNPLPMKPGKRAPAVNEARSQGGNYVAKKEANKERCVVGFWNITGREVELIVDGKSRTVARNKAVTLELGRVFVWQVGDGQEHMVTVPDGQSVFEVVLRDPDE